MMRSIFLLLICVATFSCAKVTTMPAEDQALAPVSPTTDFTLNLDQEATLNKVLPQRIRKILENGQKFSVMSGRLEYKGFVSDRVVSNLDETTRKQILERVYIDLVGNPTQAACFSPHHSIRAELDGKIVDIHICYSCANIIVHSPYGRFMGGIAHSSTAVSEKFVDQIINEQGVAP